MTVNLQRLPDPTVVEELSFETTLSEMKADLVARFPDIEPILALESSAAVKILQVCAYRETVIRARVNDAARANLLAYATGADLDHVGANSSPPVLRAIAEGDTTLRARILQAAAAGNIGSEERSRQIALLASAEVAAARAYRLGADPTVYVAIMSTATDGAASPALIATVQAAFDLPENRMVNGEVVVLSAVSTVVNITATLVALPSQSSRLVANAEASLRTAWASEGGLGRDLTRDWIKARLMVSGVYSVTITNPTADAIMPPHEAASIGTVTLTINGEAT